MASTIDESGRTSRTQSERQEYKKNKQKTLWDDMEGDIMKGKTQKKKNKLIQDILGK